MNNAGQNRFSVFLTTQADLASQAGIAVDDSLGAGERVGVHFAAGKTPAVLVHANERIDAVCANANIENAGGGRDRPAIQRQQIGEMMDVVSPARHRRAEKAVGNIPVFHRVEVRQQRFIQRLHRQRIGKVDGLLTHRVKGDKALELRVGLAQRGQVVALLVTVTRV
ncbi:Uncharacterised protein [Klebsiella michiganensis]|nr:Uncharacterised protein [Klebsiella michiganensis]